MSQRNDNWYTVYFVARADMLVEEEKVICGTPLEAVLTLLERTEDEQEQGIAAVVLDVCEEPVATVVEVDHHVAGGWQEIVVAGFAYPQGQRWQIRWGKDGKIEKRRVDGGVAVGA
jgi:hypothetical protein